MKRGLIVDDSAAIRKVAARILQTFGFETAEAHDLPAGLEACQDRMPHLILVYFHLPHALEFIADLRRKLRGKKPKVILCAIENDAGFLNRAKRAGADDFILKPFYSENIESKLRDIGLL